MSDTNWDDFFCCCSFDPPAGTGGNRHGKFPWFEVLLVAFVVAAAIAVNL